MLIIVAEAVFILRVVRSVACGGDTSYQPLRLILSAEHEAQLFQALYRLLAYAARLAPHASTSSSTRPVTKPLVILNETGQNSLLVTVAE